MSPAAKGASSARKKAAEATALEVESTRRRKPATGATESRETADAGAESATPAVRGTRRPRTVPAAASPVAATPVEATAPQVADAPKRPRARRAVTKAAPDVVPDAPRAPAAPVEALDAAPGRGARGVKRAEKPAEKPARKTKAGAAAAAKPRPATRRTRKAVAEATAGDAMAEPAAAEAAPLPPVAHDDFALGLGAGAASEAQDDWSTVAPPPAAPAGSGDDLELDAGDDDRGDAQPRANDTRVAEQDDDVGEDDDEEADDEEGEEGEEGDEDGEGDEEDEDDGGEDDEEEDEDDTPLGESFSTDAGGGLDPAIAAAARRLGIQRLYPEQKLAIRDAIEGGDVLIVMPTGFGKSACYQVPSMVLPKPVVLISPLLSLLRDQHEKLIKFGVPCVRLDGTVRGKARSEAMERIAKGGSLLIMTTPETLGSPAMTEVLHKSGISLAAIDEAHCISEWGFDFRPAYLRLGEVLRGLGAPPLLALTATATEKVRTDIVRFLGLRSPTVVAASPHRSNLAFEVLECKEAIRLRALARLAQRLRRPGIIYCSTTREVDTVFTILSKIGIPTHRYHGKMAAGDRTKQQEMFMKPGRRTVMVATSAFGLGIDKPDIRYVVHQQSPASLEQYVQEAGRAGRDGAKANCILLHDPADRTVHEALLSRSRLRPDQLYKLGSALAAWAHEGRTPTLDALALSADLGERPTNALLATLEEAGLVEIGEDLTVKATVPPDEVEEKVRSLAGQFANMRTQDSRRLDSVADYAQSTECRAVYLRRYFGEENGQPCGLCDVCRGRPDRPSTFWSPIAAPKRMKKRRRGRNQQAQGGGGGNQQKRRRGRRGKPGRPHGRPGQPGQPQRGPRPGGPPQQHGGQPRAQHNAQQAHGGGPRSDGRPQDQNGQQQRSRSSRRRRRRGRRGRRGRPNGGTSPTPPGGNGQG